MILSISIDGDKPYSISIDRDDFIIGRSSKANLQIKNECISRSHLKIRRTESGMLFITDLGSSNGTFLNNEQLTPHEEIEWHSFFPINLGQKILINLVPEALEEPQSEVQKRSQVKDNYLNLKSPDLPSEDLTRVKKLNPLPQGHRSKNSTPLIILILLAVFVGYFFLQRNQETYKSQQDVVNVPKPPSELMTKALELSSKKKCLTEREIKFCDLIKINPDHFEGTLFENDDLYIFFNFDQRLKNVSFDPSFSFADKRNQITYLMTFFIFGDLHRNFIQHLKIKEVIMVDTSESPKKINHVIRVNHSDLFKISTIDVETLKSMVLKNELELFKNVIRPMIQVDSRY